MEENEQRLDGSDDEQKKKESNNNIIINADVFYAES